MTEQLTFDLPIRTSKGRDEFFVSASNAAGLHAVEHMTTWPNRMMMIVGPKGSGKSHLAAIWTDQNAALSPDGAPHDGRNYVVDDLDAWVGNPDTEETLFHLYNHIQKSNAHLMITGRQPPNRLAIALPDLASRLSTLPVTTLDDPDDTLLGAVLTKQFRDRQLAPSPSVIPYILTYMDRSFTAAAQVVAHLDAQSLTTKKPITRAMAAQVLQNM